MMAKVWDFGDNVNTDQIIPGRYYPRENVEELGDFCLCELHPEFSKGRKKGDVIVAGENFGCGSSREYAPVALKYSGVRCVIAKSFARIFYRNAVNIGLPIMISKDAHEMFTEGDDIEVDLTAGTIKGETPEGMRIIQAEPLPEFMTRIVDAGGIINYLKEHSFEDIR